jgi:hypothetical protein
VQTASLSAQSNALIALSTSSFADQIVFAKLFDLSLGESFVSFMRYIRCTTMKDILLYEPRVRDLNNIEYYNSWQAIRPNASTVAIARDFILTIVIIVIV